MKKMTHFEIKKLIDKKILIVFVLLLIFNIGHIIFTHIDDVSSQFYQGKKKIVEKVKGTITQEKVNFLYKGLERNSKLVEAGAYDSENGDENTYTGYIFGDMNAFEEIYTDLQRVYEYSQEIEKKIVIIDENIERSQQSDSYSSFLKSKLNGRYMSSYYDTQGIKYFLDYSDSLIFIFVFIIFGGINYLYYDRNCDMEKMINITKYGRFKLKVLRYIILNVFVIISSLIFFLSDYISFSLLFDIEGLMNPIYSLSNFYSSYFDLSILSFILLQGILKLLFVSCMSCLMLYLSKKIRINYIVLVICFIVSFCIWTNFFDIKSTFSVLKLSQSFSMYKIFSFYIHDIFLVAFVLCILFFIMSLLYFKKEVVEE